MDYRINLKTINQDLKSRRFWVFGFSVAFLKSKIHSPYSEPKSKFYSKAFTIVELLVVIVVIGILAAITIVSYTGISGKATSVSLQSDLSNAKKQLALYYVDHGFYPTSLTSNCPTPDDLKYCLKPSGTNTFTYSPNPAGSTSP